MTTLARLDEARRLFANHELVAAWNVTSAALRIRPFHPEAWLLLAQIARTAGDIDQEQHCALIAHQMAPKRLAARLGLDSREAATIPKSRMETMNPAIGAPVSDPARRASLLGTRRVGDRRSDSVEETGGAVLPLPPPPPVTHGSPRLTVCLIVRNEERFLAQCLRSVQAVAAQIVVVDTGSTDRTVNIAAEFGAEVHHFDWCDDFSAARNAGLEHATGDWVLVLDADEEVLPESCETLLREIGQPEVMAYRLPILDAGREEAGPNYVPRLFRNAPGLFFAGRVHEQVFGSVEARRREWGLENRLSAVTLLHHGYTGEVLRERNKIARNLRLLNLAARELPGDPNLLMNLGLELVRSGQLEKGLERYAQAVASLSALPDERVTPELREALLTQYATHLLTAKRHLEIVQLLQDPVAQFGGLTASLHFLLGFAQMQLRQFEQAAGQMQECLHKRSRAVLTPVSEHVRKSGPHHCLALCLAAQGQAAAAEQSFRAALDADAISRPLRLDFARFLAQQNRAIEALELLQQLISEKADDEAAWIVGGQISLSQPAFLEFARDWTGEAIRYLPRHPAIIRQRAEVLLLAGNAIEALPLWRQTDQSLPRQVAACILCALLCGKAVDSVSENDEPMISGEFVKWYRRLFCWNAWQAIVKLSDYLECLRCALPTAADIIQHACLEANVPNSAVSRSTVVPSVTTLGE